jgi:para-nitrobenzyl esterase
MLASGVANLGLLDQQFALRWVKSNIHFFGGDANAVTVYGQSAGGMGICLQLLSPPAAGLFDAAMIDSGNCDIGAAITNTTRAVALADGYAVRCGCSSSGDVQLQLSCMRQLSMVALQACAVNYMGTDVHFNPHKFSPVVVISIRYQ